MSDGEDEDSDGVTIIVDNVAPDVEQLVDQRLDAEIPFEGTVFELSIGFTDPGVDDTHVATVDWGDGTGSTDFDPAVSPLDSDHTYAALGDFLVMVTVEDDDGGIGVHSFTVFVSTEENIPPTADIQITPADPVEGGTVSFDGTGSADPNPEGSIIAYDWDFGDGSVAQGAIVAHTYADNGEYTVTLVVTDNEGATGEEVRWTPLLRQHEG